MFDFLSARFQDVFSALRAEVRLTPEIVEVVLKQIRMALLEGDVNFRVVKAFVDRVRDRAVDRKVLDSFTPGQQVIGIVREELLTLFGDVPDGLTESERCPKVVLLMGLQGAGKTTTTAKLGRWLTRNGHHPLLVSTDVRRPAAIRQLAILAEDAGLRVFDLEGRQGAVERASSAVSEARQLGFDVVLVDTAGRLHVDKDLMTELAGIQSAVSPSDLLYVADAMTGQDAVKSAGEFHRRIGLTGVVLSKMDGDARGGAALSVVSVVGVPIMFTGVGERVDDLELFRPDRLVSRILGLGDVSTLLERAEQVVSSDNAARLAKRLKSDKFTLEDLREQIAVIQRMGPLEKIVELLPGVSGALDESGGVGLRELAYTTAMIDSMTPGERRSPSIIGGNRRKRIARGSGTCVAEVNRLLKQFVQMRKMLRTIQKSGLKGKVGRRLARLGLAGASPPGAITR